MSGRSPTKRRGLSWCEVVRYREDEGRERKERREQSVPIESEDTSRFDHPSRKALTSIAAQWKGRIRKIWRELSSGGRISPIYLRGNIRKRSRLNGHVAQRRVSADVPEITVAAAAASRVAPRTAFREHEESSVGEQSACRKAGLRFGGSDAGPPAAARLRHESSTQRVHRESSFLSSAGVRDTEEKEAATTKRSVCSGGERQSTLHHTTTNVRAKERRRGGARRRRQDVGDVNVPDYLVAPMRLDPFGLTGPPTSRKWKEENKRRQKREKEQQLWLSSSSSLPSTSFVECVRPDRPAYCSYASSRFFPKSIRDRVVDDGGVFAAQHHYEARHYEAGHGPDEKTGTATAFCISRDSASRGEVRARTRDRHEDHEDENDNDSDALCARTHILRADCSSPRQRRVSRFTRRARRRSRRRRGSGAIPEEGPDVATSAVSFVDVHVYTAYSDVRDDDDNGENDGDDDDDNKGHAHCEQKKIHDGSEEIHDECKENENDDNARASVSNNPCDEYEHENANENAPREDYIRTEMDASNRSISKSNQWASQSSSFDWKKDRKCVDGYDCEYPWTVDEMFDRQERRKGGKCSERRRTDNTAWFQKPIIRRKGRGEGGEGKGTGDKPRICKSYFKLLLFVLYLLAWPLLCSSSPSGHLASTFAQNPTLAHVKNPAQRGNTTPPDTSLFSSSTVIEHQYQHSQQYVQGSDHNIDSEHHRHQQQQQQQKEELQEQSDQEASEQRHPYNEYTWEVNQMNPWLSACDLAGPAPTDLQGSCGAPPPEVPKYCPKPCKNASEIMKTYNMKIHRGVEDGGESGSRPGDKYSTDEKKKEKEQCLLYLEESHKKIICQTKKEEWKNNLSHLLRRLRLRHCCEHAVFNALAPGKGGPLENVLKGDDECNNALDKLLVVDALAARLQCEFEEVLARYDCAQPYSVIHNCTHCKVRGQFLHIHNVRMREREREMFRPSNFTRTTLNLKDIASCA